MQTVKGHAIPRFLGKELSNNAVAEAMFGFSVLYDHPSFTCAYEYRTVKETPCRQHKLRTLYCTVACEYKYEGTGVARWIEHRGLLASTSSTTLDSLLQERICVLLL
jgi:hypothetical protein